MTEASLSSERDSNWTAMTETAPALRVKPDTLSDEDDTSAAAETGPHADPPRLTKDHLSENFTAGLLDLKTCVNLTPSSPSPVPVETDPLSLGSSTCTNLPNFLRIPTWGGETSSSLSTKSSTVPSSLSTPTQNKAASIPDAASAISESLLPSASKSVASISPFIQGKRAFTKAIASLCGTTAQLKGSSEQQLTIKTEDDIKDYVETTMNELLGWYGLPKMDKSDTPQLNISSYPGHAPRLNCGDKPLAGESALSAATTSTSVIGTTINKSNNEEEIGREKTDREISLENKLSSDTNNNSSSCGADDEEEEDDDDADDDDDDGGGLCGGGGEMDELGVESDVAALGTANVGCGEVPDSEKGIAIVCSWCQQNGNKLFALATDSGVKSFCSELCFTQCRRASFKRNKVCEWCKHVRHTVNFVDFQEGDVQLQFCSEKCLNQYKMNIFCTEARQHLQQIQSMSEEDVKKAVGESGADNIHEKEILITPDLWLSAPSSQKVAVKEEIPEEVPESIAGNEKNRRKRKFKEGEEPGEIWERENRWMAGIGLSTKPAHSDDSSCSNEERLTRTIRSSPAPRQKKDSLASRLLSSKTSTSHSEHGHHQDRTRNGKEVSHDSRSQQHSPTPSSVSNREASRLRCSPRKNPAFPSAICRSTLSPDQANALPLLSPWASSILPMMQSPFSPSLSGGDLRSSFNSLGYPTNPLLYSSLFAPASLPLAAHKEPSLTKPRNESRRELLRDRSLDVDRDNARGESVERSALSSSASSSYSSSDASSTPGASIPPATDPASGFVPGFTQRLPHALNPEDLNPAFTLPHYFPQPSASGMFQLPLNYGLNHPHRGGSVPASVQNPFHIHSPAANTAQIQPPNQFPVPPVTILVPYPVAIPVPFPVPIPIPISPEKLFAYFKEKSDQSKTTSSGSHWSADSANDHRPRSVKKERPRLSNPDQEADLGHPININSSKQPSFGYHIFGSSLPLSDSRDHTSAPPNGRSSSDSIKSLRQEIGRPQQKVACSSPSSSGRKPTSSPITHFTLDLSKKPRLDSHTPCSEDEAMDLSKMSSRSNSPGRSGKPHIKPAPSSDSESAPNQHGLGISRIHIIKEKPEPPLCPPSVSAPVLPIPDQSSYSGRRSRILDAPSVPKRIRSPSPERRYVRTVPRDMVDAARRRGLRARVRTK